MMQTLIIIPYLAQLAAISAVNDPSEKVTALFAQYGKYGSPGCAVAVVQDGRVVYRECFGLANLEHDIPITPATVFNVASISKPLAAFGLFLLEDEGNLSLDDDIRNHLPDSPDFGETVTIRHLLHHTSGLRDFLNLASLSGGKPESSFSHGETLDLIYRQRDLNFKPGERYLYSNSNYVLLAEIIAKASGQPFHEFTRERIFEPLEMIDTFWLHDYHAVIPRRAASYHRREDDTFRASILNTSFIGSSNLHTTLDDLLKWDRNFEEPVVGNQRIFERMRQRNHLNNGDEIAYAGGVDTGEYRGLRFFSHTGAHGGFRTIYIRFPERRFSVILFSNVASFNINAFRDIVDIYLFDGEKFVDEEAPRDADQSEEPELDAARFADYVGMYYSVELDVFYRVSIENDELAMRAPNRAFSPLAPRAGEDAFTHRGDAIRFERNDEGKVTGFLLSGGRVIDLRFERVEIVQAP